MGAAPDLVMTAVARMKAQSPQLRLRIMGDTSDQILRLLDQRRIDLHIVGGTKHPGGDRGVYGPGIIPDEDIAELKKLGVAEIFTPGAALHDIVVWLQNRFPEAAAVPGGG